MPSSPSPKHWIRTCCKNPFGVNRSIATIVLVGVIALFGCGTADTPTPALTGSPQANIVPAATVAPTQSASTTVPIAEAASPVATVPSTAPISIATEAPAKPSIAPSVKPTEPPVKPTTASVATRPIAAVKNTEAATNKEVVIFAASSLTDPLTEASPIFSRANSGVRVRFNFGGTPQLRTQLEQGARADVFLSANVEQMQASIKSGVVSGETPVFAQNKLVVITPKNNPGKITRLQDLARPGVKIIITQKDVPIGIYTREAIKKMASDASFGVDFEKKVLGNIQSEESNVKQLVTKVQLGEADAAIVYSSDVSAKVNADISTVPIPDQFNTIADYLAAVVKDAREPAIARSFLGFLVSDSGKALLRKHNFIISTGSQAIRAVLRGFL